MKEVVRRKNEEIEYDQIVRTLTEAEKANNNKTLFKYPPHSIDSFLIADISIIQYVYAQASLHPFANANLSQFYKETYNEEISEKMEYLAGVINSAIDTDRYVFKPGDALLKRETGGLLKTGASAIKDALSHETGEWWCLGIETHLELCHEQDKGEYDYISEDDVSVEEVRKDLEDAGYTVVKVEYGSILHNMWSKWVRD